MSLDPVRQIAFDEEPPCALAEGGLGLEASLDREGARPPGPAWFGDHDDLIAHVTDGVREPRHVEPRHLIRTHRGWS